MASKLQELSGYKSKKKRTNQKSFIHKPEDFSGKKRIKIDEKTTVYINQDQDEIEFSKTYLENKALYEAANNTSRFGGRKKGEVKD